MLLFYKVLKVYIQNHQKGINSSRFVNYVEAQKKKDKDVINMQDFKKYLIIKNIKIL